MKLGNEMKDFYIGIGWFLLSMLLSIFNDSVSKHTGSNLPGAEIAFFRFFFSLITLLPLILYKGISELKTSNPFIQFIRGSFLFFGITGWTIGLTYTPIATATIISFTIPFFTLFLGVFFLDEKIGLHRWASTILSFLGISFILGIFNTEFNHYAAIYVLAAILFASLDIINKKFVSKETMIAMMFYSSIVTVLWSAPFAISIWVKPSFSDLWPLFIVGVNANLMMLCFLRAFALIDATAIAPFRYLELVFSVIIGYIIFRETPNQDFIYGAMIIIPATLLNLYAETRKLK